MFMMIVLGLLVDESVLLYLSTNKLDIGQF